MNWQDAPLADAASSGARWQDAPLVGTPMPKPTPPSAPERSDGFFGNLAGGILEPIAAMGTGLVAKPVSEVMGLGAMAREAFPGAPQGDPRSFQQDIQRSLTYAPRTAAGQSQMNPLNLIPMLLGQLVGGAAHGVGGMIAPPGSELGREAVGRGVTEAIEQAPGFIGLKAPAAAAAVAPALRGAAERTMTSAIKPPLTAQRTGKGARAVDTLLEEGINVSEGGADKLRARVENLNQRIADQIANSSAVVDKEMVVSRLQRKLDQFAQQVNPNADLAAIQKSWTEFLNHPNLPGIDIPVQRAQELKQGTYRALGDKSYGELKGAEVEAQKALARGLKEEIAKVVPEVRPLNAEDSRLINALSLVERRALAEANKNPLGLGWLSLNPVHLAGWMADRSGLFKSLVARMLNTASESAPAAATAGPAFGLAVGQQAQQYGTPTGPAPPQ